MTALVFVAIALTSCACFWVIRSLARAGRLQEPVPRVVRPPSWKPGSPPARPLPNEPVPAVALDQSRWTTLDDEQLARFVRESPN